VGVDAVNGKLLWEALWEPKEAGDPIAQYAAGNPSATLVPWRTNVAVAPSPLAIDDSRVLMTTGYRAGSAMFGITAVEGSFTAEMLYSRNETQFNSECHTPILHQGRLYTVEHAANKEGLFTCFDPAGEIIWQHKDAKFGLGNWILAEGMFFILEGKTGTLRLIEANPKQYKELAVAKDLLAHEAWAPMAYADGKLIIRDLTSMVCIQVGAVSQGQ
jgi:outer membrane protein assembly factor BamB